MRNPNARLILQLADILADKGHDCMVVRATRLADKMRRKPRPGAYYMARRRSKTLLRTVALGCAAVVMAVSTARAGEQVDVRLVMKNGHAQTIEVDKDASVAAVWLYAWVEAKSQHTEPLLVMFANTYGGKPAH